MRYRLPFFIFIALSCFIAQRVSGQAVETSVAAWILSSLPKGRYAAWQLYQQHHGAKVSKTAGTAERPIGIYNGFDNSGGTLDHADSAAYYYSGSRGDNNKGEVMYFNTMRMDMLFDSGISYQLTTAGFYTPRKRVLKRFNAQDLPDSFIYQENIAAAWYNNFKGSYTYYASGKKRSYRTDNWNASSAMWDAPTGQHSYAYNAAGDITLDSFQATNSSSVALGNNHKFSYTYDGQGRLSTILEQTWKTSSLTWGNLSKDSFSYTSSGKVSAWTTWYAVGGSWQNGERYLSYYNSAGNEIAAVSQRDDQSGGWSTWDSTAHAVLNAAGLPLIDSVYKSYPAWGLADRLTKTYTSGNLLSTVLDEQLASGSFQDYQREFYFYDSYGQLTRHYDQYWDGTAWVLNANTSEQRYYYEPYTTTGISNRRPIERMYAYLYPVPAGKTVTLAMSLPSRQEVRASIYDARGKLQLNWKETAPAGLYTKELSVAALPAGTYYLSVEGAQRHWSSSFVVVH